MNNTSDEPKVVYKNNLGVYKREKVIVDGAEVSTAIWNVGVFKHTSGEVVTPDTVTKITALDIGGRRQSRQIVKNQATKEKRIIEKFQSGKTLKEKTYIENDQDDPVVVHSRNRGSRLFGIKSFNNRFDYNNETHESCKIVNQKTRFLGLYGSHTTLNETNDVIRKKNVSNTRFFGASSKQVHYELADSGVETRHSRTKKNFLFGMDRSEKIVLNVNGLETENKQNYSEMWGLRKQKIHVKKDDETTEKTTSLVKPFYKSNSIDVKRINDVGEEKKVSKENSKNMFFGLHKENYYAEYDDFGFIQQEKSYDKVNLLGGLLRDETIEDYNDHNNTSTSQSKIKLFWGAISRNYSTSSDKISTSSKDNFSILGGAYKNDLEIDEDANGNELRTRRFNILGIQRAKTTNVTTGKVESTIWNYSLDFLKPSPKKPSVSAPPSGEVDNRSALDKKFDKKFPAKFQPVLYNSDNIEPAKDDLYPGVNRTRAVGFLVNSQNTILQQKKSLDEAHERGKSGRYAALKAVAGLSIIGFAVTTPVTVPAIAIAATAAAATVGGYHFIRELTHGNANKRLNNTLSGLQNLLDKDEPGNLRSQPFRKDAYEQTVNGLSKTHKDLDSRQNEATFWQQGFSLASLGTAAASVKVGFVAGRALLSSWPVVAGIAAGAYMAKSAYDGVTKGMANSKDVNEKLGIFKENIDFHKNALVQTPSATMSGPGGKKSR